MEKNLVLKFKIKTISNMENYKKKAFRGTIFNAEKIKLPNGIRTLALLPVWLRHYPPVISNFDGNPSLKNPIFFRQFFFNLVSYVLVPFSAQKICSTFPIPRRIFGEFSYSKKCEPNWRIEQKKFVKFLLPLLCACDDGGDGDDVNSFLEWTFS